MKNTQNPLLEGVIALQTQIYFLNIHLDNLENTLEYLDKQIKLAKELSYE